MTKTLKALSLFAVPCLVVLGCATIVSDSNYPVNISSEPPGAEIHVFDHVGQEVYSGKTPTTISLKAGAGYFKGETYTVRFTMDGYVPRDAQVERGVDGWYIGGNLVFGGLIGWLVVDPITGAMWTLKDLHVGLDAEEAPEEAPARGASLNILTLDDLPADTWTSLERLQ